MSYLRVLVMRGTNEGLLAVASNFRAHFPGSGSV